MCADEQPKEQSLASTLNIKIIKIGQKMSEKFGDKNPRKLKKC